MPCSVDLGTIPFTTTHEDVALGFASTVFIIIVDLWDAAVSKACSLSSSSGWQMNLYAFISA